jgi:acetate kinase
VFAGGIGEKSGKLRQRVTEQTSCLGFAVDKELNGRPVEDVVQEVGRVGARHRTLVCQTNEQLEMARYCAVDKELFDG